MQSILHPAFHHSLWSLYKGQGRDNFLSFWCSPRGLFGQIMARLDMNGMGKMASGFSLTHGACMRVKIPHVQICMAHIYTRISKSQKKIQNKISKEHKTNIFPNGYGKIITPFGIKKHFSKGDLETSGFSKGTKANEQRTKYFGNGYRKG